MVDAHLPRSSRSFRGARVVHDVAVGVPHEGALVAKTLFAHRTHAVVADNHALRFVELLQFLHLDKKNEVNLNTLCNSYVTTIRYTIAASVAQRL